MESSFKYFQQIVLKYINQRKNYKMIQEYQNYLETSQPIPIFKYPSEEIKTELDLLNRDLMNISNKIATEAMIENNIEAHLMQSLHEKIDNIHQFAILHKIQV